MYLRSDRLIVTVDPPNMGWSRTNRFDRTSTVPSVVLDGKHTFTTTETLTSKKFTTGGVGLMAEFACPEFSDAAQPGERYHKVGVGLVRRDEKPVNITNAFYAHCEPYDADWSYDGEGAIILCTAAPLYMGWAFRVDRRTFARDNQLFMDATFTNQGEKPIRLAEYNHNFMSLDDRPIDQNYAVTFTYDFAPDQPPRGDAIDQKGRVFVPERALEDSFFLASTQIGDAERYLWTLSHKENGLRMTEEVSHKPSRVALWGTPHVISAEVFVPIRVEPGEKFSWRRTWTFEC